MKISIEWLPDYLAYRCLITDSKHEYSVVRKSKESCENYVKEVKASRPDITEWSYV